VNCYSIGNQTSRHIEEMVPFDFAIKHDFKAFEWFSDTGPLGWCERGTTTAQRSKIRQKGESHGISFSVHAPHLANPENHNDVAAILESIRFGGDIEAKIVNVHLFKSHSYRRFAECLAPLVDEAKKAGVRLSLENTPDTSPDDFNAVFGILTAMPETRANVGMCLDSGHANLHQGTRNTFLKFLDMLGGHVSVIHWHAHENWGDRDSHLPLFCGPSSVNDSGLRSLIDKLNQRGFCGSVILEQWPNPPELLVEARDSLEKLIARL
jgi:sugar phosphate isomerase/epimerase